MYNSNPEPLGLILDVEVFFFSGSLFRSTVNYFCDSQPAVEMVHVMLKTMVVTLF